MQTYATIKKVNQAMADHLESATRSLRKGAPRIVQHVPLPMKIVNLMHVNQQHIDREVGGFVYLQTRGVTNRSSSHTTAAVPKAVVQTHVGSIESVELVNLMNLEIDWHTHMDYRDGRKMSPPSPTDFISCLLCHDFFGCQISLVVTREGLYFMWPTPKLIHTYMTNPEALANTFDKFEQDLLEAFFGNTAFRRGDLSQYYSVVVAFGFEIYLVSWKDIQSAANGDPDNARSGLEMSFVVSTKPSLRK